MRGLVYRLIAIVLGLLVVVVGLEASMRLFPGMYSRDLLHWAFGKYDTLPGGMYVQEPVTRMRFMKADFATNAYSHGYWWHHRTDSSGFRNPPGITDRDVLLFGDSFIYGHGVEEDETVSHFLRSDHGIAAYNMANTGQCLYEHEILLRLYLDEFKPKTVIVFSFLNDFDDLRGRRRSNEIARPPELTVYDYDQLRSDVDILRRHRDSWWAETAYRVGVVRLAAKWLEKNGLKKHRRFTVDRPDDRRPEKKPTADGTKQTTNKRARTSAGPEPGPPPEPKHDQKRKLMTTKELRAIGLWPNRVEVPIMDPALFAPIATYYRRVVADMAERCRRRGVRLIVVQIFTPSTKGGDVHDKAQRKMRGFLSNIADKNGIEFYTTKRLFAGHDELFLPHDGHLNAGGHRTLADYLTGILKNNGNHDSGP